MALISGVLLDIRSEDEAEAAAPGCARFNGVMLDRLRAGQKMPGLVSPRFGGCLQVGQREHLDALRGNGSDPMFELYMRRLGLEMS